MQSKEMYSKVSLSDRSAIATNRELLLLLLLVLVSPLMFAAGL